MRATYVNGAEHLTPIGEWVACRLPYVIKFTTKRRRGWRLWVGPQFGKCVASFEAWADGYRLAYYPFKYVFWNVSFELFGDN